MTYQARTERRRRVVREPAARDARVLMGALGKLAVLVLAWTAVALLTLFVVLFAIVTILAGPGAALAGAGRLVLLLGLSLLTLYGSLAGLFIIGGVLPALALLPIFGAFGGLSRPDPSDPSVAPSYNEPDVAWGYALIDGRRALPDAAALKLLTTSLAEYAAQRARELGRPVELVGALAWDLPRLGALPIAISASIVANAPAHMRRGSRLRRDVTLVRAWQHTDYDENGGNR